MTSRPRRNGRSSRGGSITPDTHISLTVVQFFMVLGIAAVAIGGYWWLETNVSNASTKADSFAAKLDAAIKTNNDGFTTQDNKRDQLAKDFLASQQQIVAKVSDLNTAVTVQQHDTKTIADTLAKISDQLKEVTVVPSSASVPPNNRK